MENKRENAAKGEVFFGLHFYPGVAEYQEPNKEPYRVFLNEDTLRKMDPTFKGKPVFVMHVDGVDDNLDNLKKEVDGWVIRSFFNEADGKHWCEFIVVSEKGLRAIKNGMRLSNCYIPQGFASGGLWNGVAYAKEITGGEYEHLAIVPNPRYEESVILTPDDFKKYNEDKVVELKRLSNERKGKGMLNIFKKSKVDNSKDLEEMSVVLPKSKRELTISQLVNEADEAAEKKDMNAGMADPAHKVKMHDGSYCNVGELVEKHKALHDELEAMKAKKEDGEDQDKEYEDKDAVGNEEDKDGDKKKENEEEKDKKENKEEDVKAEPKEKEIDEAKKKNAKEKADKVRNAPFNVEETTSIDLSEDKVARGKVRYGSN